MAGREQQPQGLLLQSLVFPPATAEVTCSGGEPAEKELAARALPSAEGNVWVQLAAKFHWIFAVFHLRQVGVYSPLSCPRGDIRIEIYPSPRLWLILVLAA